MFKALIAIAFLLSGPPAFSAEGFIKSSERNVLMIKGLTVGATGFLLNTPSHGLVLISQVHVIEGLFKPLHIQWGYEVGKFYISKQVEPDAFSFSFSPEIIWKDEKLDVVVMRVPEDVKEACKCTGLDFEPYHDGEGTLIGYPIVARRVYPKTGKFAVGIAELFGHVEQMKSVGRLWKDGEKLFGDMDVISGNSGGPILSDSGKVMALLRTMRLWYGEGYRYQNPSLEFNSIDSILAGLQSVPK